VRRPNSPTIKPSSENRWGRNGWVSNGVQRPERQGLGAKPKLLTDPATKRSDGLVSTEENDRGRVWSHATTSGGESFSAVQRRKATEQPAFQVFFGKIGVDGGCEKTTPSAPNRPANAVLLWQPYFTAHERLFARFIERMQLTERRVERSSLGEAQATRASPIFYAVAKMGGWKPVAVRV